MSQDPIAAALSRQPPTRPEWLAATGEDIIDPGMKIVDPHHHLWDKPGSRYLFEDVLNDFNAGHNVIASVHAPCHSMYRARGPEAMKSVGETEFVNGIAAQSESGNYGSVRVCAGIVGQIELDIGADAEPVLEAHLQAGGGRFRGIRPVVGWHESAEIRNGNTRPHMVTETKAREAIRCIDRLGLSLDLFVFFTQVDDVVEVSRAFPNLPIIFNHMGGLLGIGPYSGQRDAVFKDWRRAMADAARCPNVFMKLGGLGMRYGGFNFHQLPAAPSSDLLVEKWAPYVEACITLFGPERCMFESNFPVDRGSCSYHVLWNAFKKIAAPYTAREKARLFRGTAIDAYRLDVKVPDEE